MPALPSQRVEMIPVERITVGNPRVRNEKAFQEIVDTIAQLGLKKPITVTRRTEAGGPYYDLVCGQGRLEAYKMLEQAEVPALVVTADPQDCLIASLVENCARRNHRSIDLLHDIRGMQERGNSNAEISRKTGLSLDYIQGIAHLIAKGEQRLLRSVDSGLIPLSVAVDIAGAADHEVQSALSQAYEQGLLKGKKLIAAKKLVEMRRLRGKGLATIGPKVRERISADALVKAYQEDTDRKRAMIRRTEHTQNRLLFITEALRRLTRDETFLGLLEEESLTTMPESLAARMSADGRAH